MKKRLPTKRRWSWKEVDLPAELLGKLFRSFAVGFYEAALEAEPANMDVLVALGDLYTREGRYKQGLEIDERLVGLHPREPVFHYNLACSLSRLQRTDEAFAALRQAIHLGYVEFEHMSHDPDLANLRSDWRWDQLLAMRREAEPEV
jgi:tetratricopeptide (TPR) repeat protein